jgi:hypothetical protein
MINRVESLAANRFDNFYLGKQYQHRRVQRTRRRRMVLCMQTYLTVLIRCGAAVMAMPEQYRLRSQQYAGQKQHDTLVMITTQ